MNWIRKRVGWIAGAVVGGFLLWLMGTAVSIQALQAESAGTLFGRKVPVDRFLQAVAAVTHQALLIHGDKASQLVLKEELERQAWERLTLLTEAQKERIRASDQEVVQELSRWPIFQTEKRFDPQAYQMILRYSLGTTPRVFEEEIRESLIIAKLVGKVTGKAQLAQEDLMESVSAKRQKVTEEELLARKRLKAYLAWYQDLLRRANPQKIVTSDKRQATGKEPLRDEASNGTR